MSTTKYPNDILPFGQDASEATGSLLSLEDYRNDRQRLVGHQPGVARSRLANRQARQASHMAAGIAQYIANRFEPGVLDNGDLDAVEAGMSAAVMQNMLWLPVVNYGVPSLVFGLDFKIYLALAPSGPGVQGVGAKEPGAVGSEEYWLDYAKSITPPPAEKYDVGQYYWFEDELARPGLFSCQGGVVQGFSKYPAAVAYFESKHGQKRLVTQAQYNALHVATWHTNADGTKVGWGGIGGVNKFVWNKSTDTLTLPDLAGMTPEQVGYGSLGVGGVLGDQIRDIVGKNGMYADYSNAGGATGPFYRQDAGYGYGGVQGGGRSETFIDTSRCVPTGPRNHGPRWISDARVYLGQPAL